MISAEPLFRVAECGPPLPMPSGPHLARHVSGDLESLSDAELLDVATAARRQTSWAQALELAAIAELTRRRTAEEAEADETGAPDYRVLSARESVVEEVAATLTLTGNAAATLVDLAERLDTVLPGTRRALETGRIDLARARDIADACHALPDDLTGQIETAVLDEAPSRTTGQLRRKLNGLIRRLAPEETAERVRATVRNRRLEVWEPSVGTAVLALMDIASEDAHAAHNKIIAAAHGIKAGGDPRTPHQIRADLATCLLQGATLSDAIRATLHSTPAPGTRTEGTTPRPAPGRSPREVPDAPSSEPPRPAPHAFPAVAGGPCDGPRTIDPNEALLDQVAEEVQRCLVLVHRQVRATGTLHQLPAAIRDTVQWLDRELATPRATACRNVGDQHGRPGYRPPAALRREITERHSTCVFPTCNQPAHRCDVDHTVPWPTGSTCSCNLAPLCRRHHRTKQTNGWKLTQIWPGLLVWITPSGTWHFTRPARE